MKLTRFRDVPQFIRSGSYEVDFAPDRLGKWVEEQRVEAGLDIDPDFQRCHVWTAKQQTAYIEFFLRGGATARTIYFNNPDWSRPSTTGYKDFVLVDGKQRLEAWRRFIAGEIKVFGSKFADFTDSLRLQQTMRVNVNNLQTKAEVLQWYLDFNSGGVVHTDEELDRVRLLLEKEKRK
jgi:hypothetical protein